MDSRIFTQTHKSAHLRHFIAARTCARAHTFSECTYAYACRETDWYSGLQCVQTVHVPLPATVNMAFKQKNRVHPHDHSFAVLHRNSSIATGFEYRICAMAQHHGLRWLPVTKPDVAASSRGRGLSIRNAQLLSLFCNKACVLTIAKIHCTHGGCHVAR